jgi:hypothetical protein
MTEYFIFLSAGIGLTLSLIGVWLSWIINAGAERRARVNVGNLTLHNVNC